MQNQEWLIINVTTSKIVGSKFYQRKGSVLDKIRADFNTGKRDRLVSGHPCEGAVMLIRYG